jgi:DNA-binding protein HU-beta
MDDRIQKKEFIKRVATRMKTNEVTTELWIDATLDTLYDSLKAGQSVTLPGFGGFYVKPSCETWAFKFNPGQKLRAVFGWSSTYKGKL